jgi:hypothetical protein
MLAAEQPRLLFLWCAAAQKRTAGEHRSKISPHHASTECSYPVARLSRAFSCRAFDAYSSNSARRRACIPRCDLSASKTADQRTKNSENAKRRVTHSIRQPHHQRRRTGNKRLTFASNLVKKSSRRKRSEGTMCHFFCRKSGQTATTSQLRQKSEWGAHHSITPNV